MSEAARFTASATPNDAALRTTSGRGLRPETVAVRPTTARHLNEFLDEHSTRSKLRCSLDFRRLACDGIMSGQQRLRAGAWPGQRENSPEEAHRFRTKARCDHRQQAAFRVEGKMSVRAHRRVHSVSSLHTKNASSHLHQLGRRTQLPVDNYFAIMANVSARKLSLRPGLDDGSGRRRSYKWKAAPNEDSGLCCSRNSRERKNGWTM